MALLIDTDLLIDLERVGGSLEDASFLGDEDCAISVITVSELLHGARRAKGDRRRRRLAFVEHLLADLRPVPITEAVARVHADIWSDLAERGEIIGAHDLWIAATALAYGFGLASRNTAEFGRVEGLRLVAPPQDSQTSLP
ncbi:MAG: PIN domain-containing protein [Thermoanaerobaculia bacterium]